MLLTLWKKFRLPIICFLVFAIYFGTVFASTLLKRKSLRIIHLTDAHANHSSVAWDNFVASGAQEKVDIVVNSGDFCDEFTDEMISKISRVRQVYAYGNHELARNALHEMEQVMNDDCVCFVELDEIGCNQSPCRRLVDIYLTDGLEPPKKPENYILGELGKEFRRVHHIKEWTILCLPWWQEFEGSLQI